MPPQGSASRELCPCLTLPARWVVQAAGRTAASAWRQPGWEGRASQHRRSWGKQLLGLAWML